MCRTNTSWPGSTKFAATKSHPSVPDPDTTSGCAVGLELRKSFRSNVKVSPKVLTKGAPTWLWLYG